MRHLESVIEGVPVIDSLFSFWYMQVGAQKACQFTGIIHKTFFYRLGIILYNVQILFSI